MKQKIVCVFIFIILTAFAPVTAAGDNLMTFEGHVTNFGRAGWRYLIGVRGYDGVQMNFYTGMATRFQPKRHPLQGERVRMQYYNKSGNHYARHVTILAGQAPSAPPKPATPAVVPPDIILDGALVVTGSRVNVRSGPGTRYPVVAQVAAGQQLELHGQTRTWYYSFMPNLRRYGWIYANLVQVVRIDPGMDAPLESSENPQSF